MTISHWDTEDFVDVPLSSLRLVRPNHPNNCLTLDLILFKELKLFQLQTIKFYFKKGIDVLILVEDRLKSVKRAQKLNKFGHSGPAFKLEDTNTSINKYYALQFHQNIFLEMDQSRACVDYPSLHFESYDECDNKFVNKFLENNFPKDFLPIWATDDIANVTKLIKLDGKVSGKQMRAYKDLIKGTTQSDCRQPCKSTDIKAVFVEEKTVGGDESKIDIIFSNIVSISRTKYPKFNLVTFVSALGGSMGFWLGLGVDQILDLVITLLSKGTMAKDL